MNIRINNPQVQPQPAAITPVRPRDQAQVDKGIQSNPAAPAVQGSVSINTTAKTDLTYGDPRLDKTAAKPDLAALIEESDRKAQEIVNLIRPLIEQQGLNLAKVVSGEQKLNIDPKTVEAAKAAIASDGEFGVQKTAERILSFAKAAIGDDPAKLDKILAAVEQGFKEAADILGGTLPDISQQTLKAIQAEFQRWKADGIPTGATVSLANTQSASAATAISNPKI
jgi:hypothetical protein